VIRDTLEILARAALQNLEVNRQRIDDLNVYPVPDGDTGTNLVLTLRRIVETIEQSEVETAAELADEIFHVALRAGRGNSGVIFSQIVRGAASVLGQSERIDPLSLAAGFRAGSDAAYRAVSHVGAVEGTILTVIREMAEEAEASVDSGLASAELLKTVLARGESALARTPEMLELLAQAGVVDAGGAGLVEIVRGVTLAANGEPLPAAPVAVRGVGAKAIHQELSHYRYCTGFVVEGEEFDVGALEDALGQLGDSLLVIGDGTAVKVHVHTNDPGAALSAATAIGVLDEIEIANMHAQTEAREQRLEDRASAGYLPTPILETGVVAISYGDGNRQLFEAENATVLEGGQTQNPSVEEIVAAIEATPAPEVIVLPNNSNLILASQQASELASKPVRVVPSRSVQAGIAAIMAYLSTNSAEENEQRMLEALSSIVTGELTIASRDVELDGVQVREGAYLGLVDSVVVACDDDFESVATTIVDRVLAEERAHLDILVGDGAPAVDALVETIRHAYPSVEVETRHGGQLHYPLLFVAE
jgi:uncharacterized protein